MPTGDPYKRAQSGRPLEIPAEAYNDFLDTAAAFKSQRHGQRSGRRGGGLQVGQLYIQNNSGTNLDQFAVVGISGPLIDPADSPEGFAELPAAIGVTPTDDHVGGRFAVLLEPIANGGTGVAIAGGVSVLRVNVTDADHSYADAVAGGSSQLSSAASGPVQLLWKQTGTGTGKWALGRFGGAEGLGLLYGTLVEEWQSGSNQVTLQPCLGPLDGAPKVDDAEDPLEEITAYIRYPLAKAAPSFFAEEGAILEYRAIPGGLYVLVEPPIVPTATLKYQVLVNGAAVDGVSQWVAGFAQAHDAI